MKQKLIRLGSMLLITSILFGACKKADTPGADNPATETSGLGGRGTESSNFSEYETGTLEVTEAQFNSLNKGEYLQAKKIAPHQYIGDRPIPWPPQPPVNPCDQDWIDFANFMNTWHTYMVNWANANCRPFRGCWQGQCVAIAYQVNPTRICDIAIKYEKHLKVFE